MRYLFSAFAIVFFAPLVSAQIEVADFDKQITANINVLSEVAPITATSSCGEINMEVKETHFSGGCMGVMERIYSFTDSCGNKARASQYITLLDDEAPVFEMSEVEQALSKEEISALDTPTVSDNSHKKVDLQKLEREEGQFIVQTFTATDICGNSNSYTRRIALKIAN